MIILHFDLDSVEVTSQMLWILSHFTRTQETTNRCADHHRPAVEPEVIVPCDQAPYDTYIHMLHKSGQTLEREGKVQLW